MKQTHEVHVGAETMQIERGKIARQADGSCVIRYGDTVVLTTACAIKSSSGRDFLPLTVDYREYSYAGGRIPGGFFKREGRPTEKEILTCRMTDRPIRPLFPEGYSNETQVISLVLSADGENDPDILAINGASVALYLSEIPFYEPIGAVRVGLIEGDVVFNPPNSLRDVSDLDLIVVGTSQAVVMVEAGANQLPEDVILDCIFKGHQELQKVIEAQRQMLAESGIVKPEWQAPAAPDQALVLQVNEDLKERLRASLHTAGKHERRAAVSAVVDPYLEALPEDDEDKPQQIKRIIKSIEEQILREEILGQGVRFDERSLDQIRAIDIEVGILPRAHGSALFTRGETQALVSATLGTSRDAQIVEEYEGESRQKFLLHYSFPPFSVGEVKFLRGPGRREIGHGVLARRALTPVLPHEEDFPYTVRVVSDIMESNGSSSMATVCGGSLALFDAAVPMLAPVAGVAMGLIKSDDGFAVLSDIAGQEDHYGDMDFKVAGTRDGITALQMDIKIAGVTREIMQTALQQAQAGRLHILDLMERTLSAPRTEMSPYAPRLHTIFISKDKIRDVIGPGGKTIRSIIDETGCEVDIDNDGKVTIASPDEIAARRALDIIERLTEVPEIGKVYEGIVRRIEPYGAFVEILPGSDGLVHISELAPYRVREVTDIVQEGDSVSVKVINIDENNKVRLSRKAVIMEAPDYNPADYEGKDYDGPAPSDRKGGGGDRGRDRRSSGRRSGRGGSRQDRKR